MSNEMQRLVLHQNNDPAISYNDFVTFCSRTASRLEHVSYHEQKRKKAPSTSQSTRTTPAGTPNNNSSGPRVKTETGASGLWTEEREDLRKKGACFSCKLPGHTVKKCPKKKLVEDVKSLETEKTPTKDQRKEET